MPEFKKEGRGFKMKGFSPFTKQTDLRNYKSKKHVPHYDSYGNPLQGTKEYEELSDEMKQHQKRQKTYADHKKRRDFYNNKSRRKAPFTKRTDPPKKKKQKDWEPAYMGADYSQEEINRMTEAEKVRNIDGYVDRRKRGTGALGMNEIATEGLGGAWWTDSGEKKKKKKRGTGALWEGVSPEDKKKITSGPVYKKKKKKSPLKKKTDPPKSAEEQMKKLNKKYEKQMGAKIDSIQKVYSKKSQFSADSLNKAVNKDINLYNKGEISQKELKRRRPGVKFK